MDSIGLDGVMASEVDSVLGNYGSLDLFAAVDLGLSSLKSGRSPSTSTRLKPILDQVKVRSVHRLRLPEMSTSPSANSDLKGEVQTPEKMAALSTLPPESPPKLAIMTFQPSLTQTIPIYYFQHEYSPNCIV